MIDRFKPDHHALADELSRQRGYKVDPAQVALKIADMDTDAIFEEATKSVDWEVWDKKEPINGVPAEDILARPEYGSADAIYLVRIDGKVVIFQPHLPGESGNITMTEEDAREVAEAHSADVVKLIANASVVTGLASDPELVVQVEQPVSAVSSARERVMARREERLARRGRR